MSEFFEKTGGSEEKSFIPPDYSDLKEEELPFDADLSGDDDDDDGDLVSDEELEHDKIVEELEENKPKMSFGSGFGSSSNKPTWGTSWGDQGNKQENNGWWGSGNQQQQKERKKK